MLPKFLLPILFSFAAFASFAAQGTRIEGRLLERGTKKPLEGVNVFVLPHKLKATTDAAGRFVVEEVPVGKFEWVVNLTGYEKLERKDKVTEDNSGEQTEKLKRTLYLERSSYQVFETTVFGKADKRDSVSRAMKSEEFLKIPGAGGDPVKAVQNMPGVNRSPGFSSQIVIQGSGPQDTRYQIEGHEVPIVFHFGGLSSVMFPESVDRVEYLAAGYGAENGRATGGLVGLWAREPRGDRTRGIVFADLLNAGVLLEGPAGEDAAYLVGLRHSYIGYVLKAVAGDNEDFDLTVAPAFTDLTGIYQKKISDDDSFRLVTVFSNDRLEFLLSEPLETEPELRGTFDNTTRFYRLIPQWTHRMAGGYIGRASLGFGQDMIEVNAGDNFFEIDQWALSLKAEVEKSWDTRWKSVLGVDNVFNWTKFDIRLPQFSPEGGVANPFSAGEIRNASGSDRGADLGVYVRNDFKPGGSSFTLSPNVRVDRFGYTGEWLFSPRPAVRYDVDDSFYLRASGGLYYQPPEPQYVDEVFGNPDVISPRAVHANLGFDKDFRGGASKGWELSMDVFYKALDRLVTPSQAVVTRDGEKVPENFTNDGKGTVYGSQAQVKYSVGPWNTSLIYTLSRSTLREPGRSEYPSAYDQTHLVGFLGSVELPRNWTLGTRLRYATGNPYTPLTGGTFDSDNDVFWPQRGPFYSERLEAFFQADLRVDKKWIFNRWILSAYVDFQNITNRKNAEAINYSYDYSQKAKITGLPTFAILGLKGEF